MNDGVQSLEQRFTQLERANRRLRWMVLGLPVLAMLLGAQTQQAIWKGKSITAEEFILTNADGKIRAALRVENDYGNLVLAGKEPNVRVRLTADSENRGAALFLVNEKDKVTVSLGLDKQNKGGHLSLFNEDEKMIFSAHPSKSTGIGSINFFDGNGTFKGGVGGDSVK